jgi:hypothetical protein
MAQLRFLSQMPVQRSHFLIHFDTRAFRLRFQPTLASFPRSFASSAVRGQAASLEEAAALEMQNGYTSRDLNEIGALPEIIETKGVPVRPCSLSILLVEWDSCPSGPCWVVPILNIVATD